MQATLLAIAIAIILALIAALVGPLFIDWGYYRGAFEARASRMVGMPVRVTGAIDARVLPSPSVVLRGIEVGAGAQPHLTAHELAIEFALGPMLRGDLRAAEMRLVGPAVRLRLDPDGRLDWPKVEAGIGPDQLSIERLRIEDGRAVLSDARSGADVAVDELSFKGELRSLAGPVKGEGGFSAEGERYFYRVSAGRADEGGGAKLKLTLSPSEHAVTIDAEGALRLADGVPGFQGTLALARPAGIAPASGRGVAAVPWRATTRVKATAASALFEQIDVQYGPEDRAIKLSGVADLRFGKAPHLNGVLSGREVDLDRAFDLPDPVRHLPVAAVRAMADTVAGAFKPPFPLQLGIGMDSVTLAGSVIQAVRGDFKLAADGLDIETFEFRAPGATQVRVSGRLALAGADATFKGPATVEAADPRAFAAWLEGRAVPRGDQIGPMRASGDVTFGNERVAIDRFRAEIDRKIVEGRLLYAAAAGGHPPRLEAELTAAVLDIDRLVAIGRAALAGSTPDLPGETALALEVGRATIAGIEAKDADVRLRLDADGLVLERVAFGDFGGAAFNLDGRIASPFSSPHGAVTLDLDARSLDGPLALLTRFAPEAAETARRLAPRLLPLKTHAALGLAAAGGAAGPSKLTLDGTAGPVRLRLAAQASGDPSAPLALDTRLDGEVSSDDGGVVVQLLGLDRAVAVDKQPGRLSFVVQGVPNGELHIDARLAAGGFAAGANGTARLLGPEPPSGVLDVSISAAAVRLPHDAGRDAQGQLPVAVTARLTAARAALTFDDIAGTVAGVPVRGRLETALGTPVRIDGRIDADSIDLPALTAAAIGARAQGAIGADAAPFSSDPFASGVFDMVHGRLRLSATSAAITPGLAVRQGRADVHIGESEIAFKDIDGELAGGRLTGALTFRRIGEGIATHASFALADADAAALLPGEGRAPLSGRLAFQVEADGSGLSPAMLVGSLTGTGTATLTAGEIAGFDPDAFNAVIRAVEQDSSIDAAKVRDIVAAALDRGSLRVARADGALSLSAGGVRLGTAILHGEGADLSATGHFDLTDRRLDGRLTFTGSAPAEGVGGRPEVYVTLRGPLGATQRTIDVTALSAWLTLRAVDREAKRIDAIEAAAREAGTNPSGAPPEQSGTAAPSQSPAPPQPPAPAEQVRRPAAPSNRPEAKAAPALPPPINIRPLPSATGSPARPKGSGTAANPPAARQNTPAPADAAPAQEPSLLDRLFGSQR
ncbi:MAG TPA: AsmA family protein [Xanthobacteraceae bacterium]|nr:AsmA family protein [Xanthobacteraceae bacterium]